MRWRSADLVKHMWPDGLVLRKARVLEVVRRVAGHAELIHHAPVWPRIVKAMISGRSSTAKPKASQERRPRETLLRTALSYCQPISTSGWPGSAVAGPNEDWS
jgi:hypothetical protein